MMESSEGISPGPLAFNLLRGWGGRLIVFAEFLWWLYSWTYPSGFLALSAGPLLHEAFFITLSSDLLISLDYLHSPIGEWVLHA